MRHKFSKKEADKYRKAFYVIKNYRHLSTSEIEEARKNLIELRKSQRFKKFHSDIDSVDYDDLDNYDFDDDNYDFADDDEYRRIGTIRTLFKEFDRDYYNPIRTDDGFAVRRNNYVEHKSKGDRYENLLPEEYLNMIKTYLRDLINDHKPMAESINEENDSDADRAEWKIQLVMQNSCISTRNFEETRTIYSASEPVEIFMGSDTEDIDTLFNTILQRFQQAQENQMIKEANLFLKLLNYYIIFEK